MAIDKDKVFGLFGRYWEIAYNEGRTGEGFPDLANDVLAELRDELDADDSEVFTGVLVEIDGHTYGLRPGAARVVKEAMRDQERFAKWIVWHVDYKMHKDHACALCVPHSDMLVDGFVCVYHTACGIDAAMAKDGA